MITANEHKILKWKPATALKTLSLASVCTTLALGGSVGAASAASASAEPLTVTILSGQESQNGQTLENIWHGFNGSNGGVKVNLELSNDSDSATVQKAIAEILAGNPPDAVRVTSDGLPAFVDSGRAQPLDSCLASDPALRNSIRPDILKAFSANGHVYAMPWYVTVPALFYNPNLFTAAGLNPNEPPATWAQLVTDATKLTNKAKDQSGVLTYMPETYLFESLLFSAGGNMVNGSGTQAAFNSTAGAQVLQAQRSLVASGDMPLYSNGTFWTDSSDDFSSGKVAMMISSSSDYSQIASSVNFPLRIAPLPSIGSGPAVGTTSFNGFVMLTKNPAAQKATCQALLALISPKAITETVEANATVPLSNSVATSPRYLGPFYAKHPDLLKVNAEAAKSWYILPGTGDPQFENDFANAQYLVLNGSETAKTALAGLASEFDSLVANSKG
jgi:ABC-type glycerol-3-phosphate transport system substrate-binding protein